VLVAVLGVAVLAMFGVLAYWGLGGHHAAPIEPAGEVAPEEASSGEGSAASTDPAAAEPAVTADATVEGADVGEDVAGPAAARACKSSRDCDDDEMCIDGVCEAD